jgi:DNA-binding IclR family transcriptional regulator
MSVPEGDVSVAEGFAKVTGRQPQAIRTALAVLRAVAGAGAGGGITARQLSAELGVPPATTYRIVSILVRDEYLVRLPGRRGLGLGARAADLASAVAVAGCPCGRATHAPRAELAARQALTSGGWAFAGRRACRRGRSFSFGFPAA